MADVFRIAVEGAGPSAQRFDRAQRRVQDSIIREYRRIAPDIEAEFRAAAPVDRGQIRDRLRAVMSFNPASEPRITVRTAARDPESRYAYIRVTRFGHRKAIIRARHVTESGKPGMLKVYVEGHRNPHIFIFRHAVAGARPSHDWVATGAAAARPIVNAAARRLGRTITRSLL
jgi:hypothetical protein